MESDAKRFLFSVIRLVVIAGLALIVLAFVLTGEDNRGEFWFEVGKAGMQMVGVAAIGAFVTYAASALRDAQDAERQRRDQEWARVEKDRDHDRQVAENTRQHERLRVEKEQERNREEMRRQSEYWRGLLRQLRAAYGATKRVRRRLEVAGFKPEATYEMDKVRAEAYTDGMAKLVDIKLDLEAIQEELDAWTGDKTSKTTINRHVKALEDYLDNGVINEYRKHSPISVSGPSLLSNADFKMLHQFTGQASSGIADSFYVASCHYHAALWVLNREILRPPPISAAGDDATAICPPPIPPYPRLPCPAPPPKP